MLIGVYAWNDQALAGAVLQMICHGLSTGALFMLAGALQERAHTRELDRFGGLQSVVPRMAAMGMFFAMASLGLPGPRQLHRRVPHPRRRLPRASRVPPSPPPSAWCSRPPTRCGSCSAPSTVPTPHEWRLPDLSTREILVFGAMAVALIVLGVYPQPFLDAAQWTVDALPSVGTLMAGAGAAP